MWVKFFSNIHNEWSESEVFLPKNRKNSSESASEMKIFAVGLLKSNKFQQISTKIGRKPSKNCYSSDPSLFSFRQQLEKDHNEISEVRVKFLSWFPMRVKFEWSFFMNFQSSEVRVKFFLWFSIEWKWKWSFFLKNRKSSGESESEKKTLPITMSNPILVKGQLLRQKSKVVTIGSV